MTGARFLSLRLTPSSWLSLAAQPFPSLPAGPQERLNSNALSSYFQLRLTARGARVWPCEHGALSRPAFSLGAQRSHRGPAWSLRPQQH